MKTHSTVSSNRSCHLPLWRLVGAVPVCAMLSLGWAAFAQAPDAAQAPEADPLSEPTQISALAPRPIAIVPLDSSIHGAASRVTGDLQIANGRAFIVANASITSGSRTTQVTLPYRGTLRICASTSLRLTADASVAAGGVPGLLMALDHGAMETSFATGRNTDVLLTPDFRILIGGTGSTEVKIRLGQHGDTCVDNAEMPAASSSQPGAAANPPFVLVTSVFDSGAYRVMPGQRVMFQHGSLREVVDREKEPCGCPPPSPEEQSNEFPLAQSEGLAPLLGPRPAPVGEPGHAANATETLAYNAAEHAPRPASAPAQSADSAQASAQAQPKVSPAKKKQHKGGFWAFLRRLFGAE